ncbi:hypothetical protein ACROYT_G017933 [Oculina patagonica]
MEWLALRVEQGESGRYESYLQWWEDGKKRLYVYGDVENAARSIIRRFLTLTAKRSRMIYPSIANTVMILEHQLTACLALYTRLCTKHRYPVCLPASYLSMVRFWDNFESKPGVEKGIFTLYEAVEHSFAQESNRGRLIKAVCSLLDYMGRGRKETADALDVGEEESLEVKYRDEELKDREEARLEVNAIAIQKWYRRMKSVEKIRLLVKVLQARKLRRLESIEEQTTSSSNVLEEHFVQFKVDSSACGICGTNFKVSTDESLPMSSEDNEGDQ